MINLKRALLLILSLTIFSNLSAQSKKLTDEELNKSTVRKIRWADTITCSQIDDWLKSDINNQTIFLFLDGGIAPVVHRTDQDFEQKYKVYYFDFGDTPPELKCVIKYNQMVFDYLTNTFGKKWIKQARKDIIGLSAWKKHKS
jgi:hypothetical protein